MVIACTEVEPEKESLTEEDVEQQSVETHARKRSLVSYALFASSYHLGHQSILIGEYKLLSKLVFNITSYCYFAINIRKK